MADETTNATSPAPAEAVDINSLQLEMEPIDVNTEGDAFAAPPPAPAGIYTASLKRNDGTNAKGWQKKTDKNGRPFLFVDIVAKLNTNGEKYDGALIFDFASTVIQQSSGTCRIAGILKAGGQQVAARVTPTDLAKQFDAWLLSEPAVKVQIDWKGYCQTCEKDTLRSMTKFPPIQGSTNGARAGAAECPKCGGDVSAKAEVKKYLPLN